MTAHPSPFPSGRGKRYGVRSNAGALELVWLETVHGGFWRGLRLSDGGRTRGPTAALLGRFLTEAEGRRFIVDRRRNPLPAAARCDGEAGALSPGAPAANPIVGAVAPAADDTSPGLCSDQRAAGGLYSTPGHSTGAGL